jgi:hypothetical protein
VRCWKERVAAGAERVKDWRILDAIAMVMMFVLTVDIVIEAREYGFEMQLCSY